MGVLDDLAESVQESKKPASSTSSVWSGGGGLESAASTSSSSSSSSKPSATSSGAGSVSSASTGGLNTALATGGGSVTAVPVPDVYSSAGSGQGTGASGSSSLDPTSGGYTFYPPPMAELDPGATYGPPGYSSYNLDMGGSSTAGNNPAKGSSNLTGSAGLDASGSTGNGASGSGTSEAAAMLAFLAGLAQAGNEGSSGSAALAKPENADDIGTGADPDSDMAWVSFNNWLATQQPPPAEPAPATGVTDWLASYQQVLAGYAPGEAPAAAPTGELTSRSVTTVPIDPKTGQPEGTTGTASSVYDYLVQYYGPPETWTPELWKQLNENLGVEIPLIPSSGTAAPAPYEPAPGEQADELIGASQEYTDPAVNVPLPRPRPDTPVLVADVSSATGGPEDDLVWEPAVTGETTPLDAGEKPDGDPWQQLRFGEEPTGTEGMVTGSAEGPTEEPSAWDKTVDNAGKLLSHTGLGALISTLFPDIWNAGGDMMKGLDSGGGGSFDGMDPAMLQTLINKAVYSNQKPKPAAAPDDDGEGEGEGETPLPFPDANNNGIDDRIEGYVPPPVYDPNGIAVFPDMPPYRPGLDDEWLYFRKEMANGGYVQYADGGPVSLPDPRVQVIADAEDALQNMAEGAPEENDAMAIKKFVDQFGAEALRNLQQNVSRGTKLRPGKGRMVVGPGGPKDDAIPAIIDGSQPAALSSGEFVIPAEAVAGAGNGDPMAGAEALQQLSDALGRKAA